MTAVQGERILVVDDEPHILKAVRRRLERSGFQVEVAADGEEALEKFERFRPDLVVLDLMLPRLDGYEVCHAIRERSSTPIVILSARSEEQDRLTGFWLGADDYLTKPFSLAELVLRIQAVLRRARGGLSPGGFRVPGAAISPAGPSTPPERPPNGGTAAVSPVTQASLACPASGFAPGEPGNGGPGDAQAEADEHEHVLHFEGLVIDRLRRMVWRDGEPVELTAREFDLLWLLASHPMVVFPREQILDRLWHSDYAGDLANVTVCVSRLREKLERGPEFRYIQTVRGVGYRFGALPLRPRRADPSSPF